MAPSLLADAGITQGRPTSQSERGEQAVDSAGDIMGPRGEKVAVFHRYPRYSREVLLGLQGQTQVLSREQGAEKCERYSSHSSEHRAAAASLGCTR